MSGPLCAVVLIVLSCSSPPARPSIVIVVLDTVRRDFTGLGSSVPQGRAWAPHLDELAREAAVFPRAWANAPWTVPSHASLFTGELPAAHGCTSLRPRFDAPTPALAEVLGAAGYRSAAFFSNPWLSDEVTGLLRGFDEKLAAETPGPVGEPGQDQGGAATLRNVDEWLGRRGDERPFLLFVNFLEAHAPYDPPKSSRDELLPDLSYDERVTTEWMLDFQAGLTSPEAVDWPTVRRLYGGDVHFADALLGELIRLLRKHDVFDDGVILVTSDHGENLGELGYVNHQFRIDEALLAVPLLLRAPGRVEPGERSDPAMLTDVFATVLELAGVKQELPRHSRSLVKPAETSEPRALFAEYTGGPPALVRYLQQRNPRLDPTPLRESLRTVRWGDLRLTVGGGGVAMLHDLAADPQQRVDIAAEAEESVRTLAEQLAQAMGPAGRGDEPERTDGAPDVSKSTKERLESLGYVH
jgi:arylsulfatase A-like enzyme